MYFGSGTLVPVSIEKTVDMQDYYTSSGEKSLLIFTNTVMMMMA
jgi:hypothetical protein